MYIGGNWENSISGETIQVLNPSTGEVFARVPAGNDQDVSKAVQAAEAAFPEWSKKDPVARQDYLLGRRGCDWEEFRIPCLACKLRDGNAQKLRTASGNSRGS